MSELFSDSFLKLLRESLIEATVPHLRSIESQISAKSDLNTKEFWSTKELVQRGWMVKQLDDLVATGRLARIDAGGSAGFKYPSIQLKQIIENYDLRPALTLVS